MESESDTGFDSSYSDEEDEVPETENKRKRRDRKKPSKKLKSNKPPTVEELNRLRETENLFHSNLFRLQIEEMIKEVQTKEKHKKQLETWFSNFQNVINELKDKSEIHDVHDQKWLKKLNVKMPIVQDPFKVKGQYQFLKPVRSYIAGSYELNLNLGPKSVVDIELMLPKTFYQKIDMGNTCYHRKRALYLCELVHLFQLHPGVVKDVHFVCRNDAMKPELEIIPEGKAGKHFTIYLRVVPSPETFTWNKFSPSKNNMKMKWFFSDQTIEENPATPHYNHTLIQDLTCQINTQYLKQSLNNFTNLREGILLLKVWLKQRELNVGVGSFNGFIASMLVAYLTTIKKINSYMSSYQIVRNVWNFIANSDWTTSGITLCETNDDKNIPLMSEFHQHYDVVFVDRSGYNNLTSFMSIGTYSRLKHEAKLALNFLENSNINSFQVLFMTCVPFYTSYDHVLNFNDEDIMDTATSIHCCKETKMDYVNNTFQLSQKLVYDLLKKGLGERVSDLHLKQPIINKWKVDKKPKVGNNLIFGFNTNPELGFNMVMKGPEANLAEADEFRTFWGSKSELRRFQDGSITEAVVWNCKTLREKRLINKQIIEYLLKLKLNIQPEGYIYIASQLEDVLIQQVNLEGLHYGTGEEVTLNIIDVFNQLSKQLRDLTDIPLSIVSVQGSSPVFRYTDVYPPIPCSHNKPSATSKDRCVILTEEISTTPPPYVTPLDVVIQLSVSKKWPYDLQAIRRIKSAFCLKICQLLQDKFGITAQAFFDHFIVLKDGFIFKFNIYYPNEVGLLKKIEQPDGIIKYKDNEQSLTMDKLFVQLPVLTSTLHGLHQQYPSYGPACCITKRWITSQMLDAQHVPDVVIELLMSAVYLRPEPYTPPHQPQVAFCRFLHFISSTNWTTDPLILNFNDEFNRQDILEIETHFNTNRACLPSMFISTPHDKFDSVWTKHNPTTLILIRLMELSKEALNMMETNMYKMDTFDVKLLFTPSLEPYDVLLHIHPAMIARYNHTSTSKPKLTCYEKKTDERLPVIGFDPVQFYINELREIYDEFALFFSDTYGGSVIGVLWKPNNIQSKEFKVTHIPCREFNTNSQQLEFNMTAVVEDFFHIGRGLVKKIERKIHGVFKEVSRS